MKRKKLLGNKDICFMSSSTFGRSENPIVALFIFLYVEGHDNDSFWRVLESLEDEPTFEITINDKVYSMDKETLAAFKAARKEIEEDFPGYALVTEL